MITISQELKKLIKECDESSKVAITRDDTENCRRWDYLLGALKVAQDYAEKIEESIQSWICLNEEED